MKLDASLLQAAYAKLGEDERKMLVKSDSVSQRGPSVTSFSIELVSLLLSQLDKPQHVRAVFKGNGGGAGGLKHLIALAVLRFAAPVTFTEEEILLDFLVTGGSLLEVKLTVESEAVPIAPGNALALHDFEKLLLVSSPQRLFVGRVNVTTTGDETKLNNAFKRLRTLLKEARRYGHVRDTDVVGVVLIQTGAEGAIPRAHFATSSGQGTLAFREAKLVPS